jgi:AcrR family transcriptional regulator
VTIKTAITSARKRITKAPEVRREELMDAAVRVFASKGVSRTTVSDITEKAGVAKGTFYLYFPSKEALLGALKERFVDEILQHAASLYEKVGLEDWWALVDQTVEAFVDFHLDRTDLIHVIVQEGFTPETSDLFAECERRIDAMFADGIRRGMEAGVFKVSDPDLISRMLHHAFEGTMNHAVLYDQELDRERLIRAAEELVHKVLSP